MGTKMKTECRTVGHEDSRLEYIPNGSHLNNWSQWSMNYSSVGAYGDGGCKELTWVRWCLMFVDGDEHQVQQPLLIIFPERLFSSTYISFACCIALEQCLYTKQMCASEWTRQKKQQKCFLGSHKIPSMHISYHQTTKPPQCTIVKHFEMIEEINGGVVVK